MFSCQMFFETWLCIRCEWRFGYVFIGPQAPGGHIRALGYRANKARRARACLAALGRITSRLLQVRCIPYSLPWRERKDLAWQLAA